MWLYVQLTILLMFSTDGSYILVKFNSVVTYRSLIYGIFSSCLIKSPNAFLLSSMYLKNFNFMGFLSNITSFPSSYDTYLNKH